MINNEMEYILCAAVWYKELELKKPEMMPNILPTNIKSGIVFYGRRHHICMYTMTAITGLRDCESGENEDGFLTSKNRFVDRIEGAKIALESDQIQALKYCSKRLFSEDLY